MNTSTLDDVGGLTPAAWPAALPPQKHLYSTWLITWEQCNQQRTTDRWVWVIHCSETRPPPPPFIRGCLVQQEETLCHMTTNQSKQSALSDNGLNKCQVLFHLSLNPTRPRCYFTNRTKNRFWIFGYRLLSVASQMWGRFLRRKWVDCSSTPTNQPGEQSRRFFPRQNKTRFYREL